MRAHLVILDYENRMVLLEQEEKQGPWSLPSCELSPTTNGETIRKRVAEGIWLKYGAEIGAGGLLPFMPTYSEDPAQYAFEAKIPDYDHLASPLSKTMRLAGRTDFISGPVRFVDMPTAQIAYDALSIMHPKLPLGAPRTSIGGKHGPLLKSLIAGMYKVTPKYIFRRFGPDNRWSVWHRLVVDPIVERAVPTLVSA